MALQAYHTAIAKMDHLAIRIIAYQQSRQPLKMRQMPNQHQIFLLPSKPLQPAAGVFIGRQLCRLFYRQPAPSLCKHHGCLLRTQFSTVHHPRRTWFLEQTQKTGNAGHIFSALIRERSRPIFI